MQPGGEPGTPDHDAATLLDTAGAARLREAGFAATAGFGGWSRDLRPGPVAGPADLREPSRLAGEDEA